MPVTDVLSREFLLNPYQEYSKGTGNYIHSLMKLLPVSNRKIEDIKTATQRDPGLLSLIKVIQDGWPEQRKSYHPYVIEYWNHHNGPNT